MSEEEIINVITKMLEKNDDIFEETGNHLYFSKMTAEAIQGLLDLYNNTKKSELILANKFQKVNIELNKEKEKNKKIEDKIKVKLEKLKGQKGQYRLMLEQEYKELLEE